MIGAVVFIANVDNAKSESSAIEQCLKSESNTDMKELSECYVAGYNTCLNHVSPLKANIVLSHATILAGNTEKSVLAPRFCRKKNDLFITFGKS